MAMPLQLPKEESTLENSKIMILTEGALASTPAEWCTMESGKRAFFGQGV